MNENTTNKKQPKPKLDGYYSQEAVRNSELGYMTVGQKGSQHIVWAKSAMDNFVSQFKQLQLKVGKLKSQIQTLRDELTKRKNRIAELEREYKILATKHEKLQSEYQKFAQHKGQGRPKILTDQVKTVIREASMSHGKSVTEIHKALTSRGLEVSYEAIRKYIAHGKATGDWS